MRDTQVHDAADFKKVSHDELVVGFRKLEEVVRPAVQEGADGDDFARLDAERGLDYEHGNRRVYDVADRAMDLAEAHGPRGYDAVHLAASLEVQAGRRGRHGAPLAFVSADIGQLQAAAAEGLAVENPTVYP